MFDHRQQNELLVILVRSGAYWSADRRTSAATSSTAIIKDGTRYFEWDAKYASKAAKKFRWIISVVVAC